MNQDYKPKVVSPFQMKQNKPFERIDPLREEVERNLSKFTLEFTVEEDIETLS